MSEKIMLLSLAIVCLTILNIAAFRYMGIFAFFFTAACIPFAEKILDIIQKL